MSPPTPPKAGPKRAIALSYKPGVDVAPTIAAVENGPIAEEIIRRARQAGVPVTQDSQLATILSQLDLGTVIPPELYLVVAEVLAYVYRLDSRAAHQRR